MSEIKFVHIPTQFVNMDGVPDGYYPVSAFAKGNEIIVEISTIPEDVDIHSCDWERCGTFNHVVRFNVAEKYGLLPEEGE